MNTKITISESQHTQGAAIYTVSITSSAMGESITATLSGAYLYALIDGLLWWTINRKLERLVATSMSTVPSAEHAAEFGQALGAGEELVHHVFTTPFHEANEHRQERIVTAILRRLPALAGITRQGPHAAMAKADLAELTELATLLRERIDHVAEALHGLEGMYTMEKLAA